MKRWIAALFAILCCLASAGCQHSNSPEAATPPTAAAPDAEGGDTAPETADGPTVEADPEADPEPAPAPTSPETGTAPETTPESGPETPGAMEPEPDEPTPPPVTETVLGAELTVSETTGQAEDAVSYLITMPQVATGSDSVDEGINGYYDNLRGKLEDLARGEVYETATQSGSPYTLHTNFQVTQNDPERLSILRQTLVTNTETGETETTEAAETFRLSDGALLLAGDFFSVPEAAWTEAVVDIVRAQIAQDSPEKYASQWPELAWSAFDKDRFYVTPETFCVLYPQGALGPDSPTVFSIPWSQLADITA